MKKIRVETYLSLIAVSLIAAVMRLLPHAPNIAPIGGLALFTGAAIPSGAGIIAPIIAMLVSDSILGFHSTVPYVYGSFFLIFGIGYLLRKSKSPFMIGAGSILGSVLFFIITNFGVWLTSSMYEKNMNGLLYCYIMGLPFFRNTLVGDIFYTAVFFLSFNALQLLIVLMLPSRLNRERHVGNTV